MIDMTDSKIFFDTEVIAKGKKRALSFLIVTYIHTDGLYHYCDLPILCKMDYHLDCDLFVIV